MSRAYHVCKKCGPSSWIFQDRVGSNPFCQKCGCQWPKATQQKPTAVAGADWASRNDPVRVWKNKGPRAAPQKGRPDGKIHRALHSLWEKFTPAVQQGLLAAGWKPKEEDKPEPPPGLPRKSVGGGIGKGKGKGKQQEQREGDAAQALWTSANADQKALLQQLGFNDPSPSEPADLKSLVKAHMDQLPESLKQAIASLEPQTPEQVITATRKFKASTNELRQLIQKSAGLQVKIDRAKSAYADLLDQMKSVQEELTDKQNEVAALQKDLESRVQSAPEPSALPCKEAVLRALQQCGINLSSEQQALLDCNAMEVEEAKEETQQEQPGAPKPAQVTPQQGSQPPEQSGAAGRQEGGRDEKPRSRSRGRTQG
ncbi:unnamed protein product [Symbiodinium sp. CCMP2592]|nr:unnamed protein product [Symbiodinium sp. CCMP2592]